MSSSDELVLSERLDRVLLVTLKPSDSTQRLDRRTRGTVLDVLTEADANPAVRAVVVTGAGRDSVPALTWRTSRPPSSGSLKVTPRRRPRDLPLTIQKPMIGAINGVVAGLGVVEALYFDVRFGSSNTPLQ